MSLTLLSSAAFRPVAFPMAMTACGTGPVTQLAAYHFAWARARALVAQQARARFDPHSN